MTFTINCVPPKASHHAKRIAKFKLKNGQQVSRMADKAELVEAKGTLEAMLLPHQPATPIAGPVCLSLEFTWPWRKSESKRNLALGRMVHDSRPDLTNLAKTIEDRLVKMRFIEDDGKVVELTLRKFWGDKPGITVSIAPFTVASAFAPGRPAPATLQLEA
jgi:Holliday junction resolvase RusA-like endonuclease